MRQIILALAFVMAACGGGSSPGPSTTTLTGTYALQAFNGNALPYVVNITGDRLEVLSGSLVLGDGGDYTTAFSIRFLLNGAMVTQNKSDAGNFTVVGTMVTLKSRNAGTRDAIGSIAGKSATFFDGKDTFFFQKP